jgi:hypothetical protein
MFWGNGGWDEYYGRRGGHDREVSVGLMGIIMLSSQFSFVIDCYSEADTGDGLRENE